MLCRLLIVDDDPEIRRLLQLQLASLACEITSVEDVPQAIEVLEEKAVDVVLLDLMLPGVNGMELLRYIREQDLPVEVVVMTAYASLKSAIEAVRLGAYDYIVKPFDEVALRTIVARALEKRRLATNLMTIHHVGQRIALAMDRDQIVDTLLETTGQATGCEICCLWTVDRDRGELRLLAERIPPEGPGLPSRIPLDDARSVDAAAAREGERLYIPDVQSDPHYTEAVEGVHTELAIPLLRVEDRILGVLGVKSSRREAMRSWDLQLLSALAAQAAVALERVRLLEAAQRHAEEMNAVCRSVQAMSSTMGLQQVLTRVLEEGVRLLHAQAGLIWLHDADTDQLTCVASLGTASDGMANVRIPADAGIAGQVFQQAEPLLVRDARRDPRFRNYMDTIAGANARSFVAVPLVCKDRTVGVVEVIDPEPAAFDEHDLMLLNGLAGPAAVVIENTRLVEETSRLLSETRVLQEVTIAAASTLDFDQVLTRTLQAIRRTLHTDYLVFALPDASGEGLTIHPSLIGFVSPSEEHLRIPLEESVCGRAYVMGQSQLVSDLSGSTHYFVETSGLRSMLAVPVMVKGRVTAVLGAGSLQKGAFTRSEVRLFEAIAAQLGIVMENARLYEAERELRKLVEASRAQLVMSERLAATGRLTASLAHEINNPLQAIHNSLQLMLTFPLEPEEQQEYLQLAAGEVKRLMELVGRILDFARRPRHGVKPARVNELVTRALALCNKYLQHNRVSVRQDLCPDLPLVLANPDELIQVFLNLILNAVDAMPEGGRLSVTGRLTEDGWIAISFTDTGRGIPEEHLERIFEPFFTTKENGVGLGLSVSRDMVRRYGGEITVQSTVGEGATFTVRLPPLGKTSGEEA